RDVVVCGTTLSLPRKIQTTIEYVAKTLRNFSSKKDIIDITSSQKVHKWLNNRAPLFTREMVDVDFRI
ncbi:hypothetical protein, partial [Xanthomonas campestris]